MGKIAVAGVDSQGRLDPRGIVTDQVYFDALSAVNEIRRASGKKPLDRLPYGRVGEASECPLYNALEAVGITAVNGDVIEGEINLKGGGRYDLDMGTFSTNGTTKVSTPLGDMEIEVDEAESVKAPPMVQRLRSVAGKFVTQFDSKGEKYLEKNGLDTDGDEIDKDY